MCSPFLQHLFFLFFLLLCGELCETQKVSSLSTHGLNYANHHNACTRKLLCIIAARPDGESYEEIRQGFDYFFGGLETLEPFKSERYFLDEAWNIGRQNAPNNEVCSHLNTTHTCPMSSERLLETFDDIYEEKNEIEEKNFEAKSRQSRQASLGGLGKGLMQRLRKVKFMGRPFLRPDGAADRAVCQVCEKKRSACFNYYIGTYGLCGGAWIVAGVIGTATCNIITIPRTIDCTINAWFNCLAKDCGFVGFK